MGRLRFYLGTPGSALHAHLAEDCPVLISFAAAGSKKWLVRDYVPSFSHVLIDSGAYSELNSNVKVELPAYIDWIAKWGLERYPHAGLDHIRGDWKRSLRNYEAQPTAFPTIHDSDPPGLLDDLIDMALERPFRWIGIGLVPPRTGKEDFVRRTLDAMPDDLHVHGWALGMYAGLERLDSVDSTNWFRDVKWMRSMKDNPMTAHLTPGECLEIIVKRYQRAERIVVGDVGEQMEIET